MATWLLLPVVTDPVRPADTWLLLPVVTDPLLVADFVVPVGGCVATLAEEVEGALRWVIPSCPADERVALLVFTDADDLAVALLFNVVPLLVFPLSTDEADLRVTAEFPEAAVRLFCRVLTVEEFRLSLLVEVIALAGLFPERLFVPVSLWRSALCPELVRL